MSPISTGIYGGGPLFLGGQPVIDDLRASGMTTVIGFALHIATNGDILFNDKPAIVSGGKYDVDDYSAWPQRLASLKTAPTSVNRLLFSVGGWAQQDFPNIQALIQQQGTGPDSTLYQNFAALKAAIPTIDGIDFDDEDLYDQATTVAFAQMLHGLGYDVTFCPFSDPDFWVACLKQLNGTTPGLVTAFNLQCYAGGAGNTPDPWIKAVQAAMGPSFDAKGFVLPGLWCSNGARCGEGQDPASIHATFKSWKPSGIQGGWIWELDDIYRCEDPARTLGAQAYAKAIRGGLS